MIVKLEKKNGDAPDNELDVGYDGVDLTPQREPPPSYEATSPSISEMDGNVTSLGPDTSLQSPTQVPFNDLIAGSSSRPTRSLRSPRTPTREEQQPHQPSLTTLPSHEPTQQSMHSSTPSTRPLVPHASRSTPDPRTANMAQVQGRDPFGRGLADEGPFAAARRAQLAENFVKTEPDPRVYVNGRMPSFKVGEIVPVNTMRAMSGAPPFVPPQHAPSFPPITDHPPIRPAHFPPELHPPQPAQPTRAPSQREPTRALQPIPQPTMQSPPMPMPVQPQLQPQPPPQPSGALPYGQPRPQGPQRSHSQRHPTAPLPQSDLQRPSQSRRYTYDVRGGIPPGLMPNDRGPHPVAPQPRPPPIPQGYLQQYPQPPPPGRPSGGVSQPPPPVQIPQRDRSIQRPPQRYSTQGTPSPTFGPPAPTPVRLPSENISRQNTQTLGTVHAPPSPSRSSPRPDSDRAPRITPKPVMPQLLEPLAAQENNYPRSTSSPLQRAASSAQSEKGGLGLFSRTRSILRKRSSTPGIKTNVDGAAMFAPQPHSHSPSPSSKRAENHVPALSSVKEESGGFGRKMRLSKKR